MPDSMKKELTPYGVGSFFISSATSLSQVVSNEVREYTWLGYRPPRPVGETGGRYHLGESEPQRLIFSDCPNQCATLYLVRILSAARCAGFRQAKSPGRVGRCHGVYEVAWKPSSIYRKPSIISADAQCAPLHLNEYTYKLCCLKCSVH